MLWQSESRTPSWNKQSALALPLPLRQQPSSGCNSLYLCIIQRHVARLQKWGRDSSDCASIHRYFANIQRNYERTGKWQKEGRQDVACISLGYYLYVIRHVLGTGTELWMHELWAFADNNPIHVIRWIKLRGLLVMQIKIMNELPGTCIEWKIILKFGIDWLIEWWDFR